MVLPHLIYLPEDYADTRQAWPLVLFFHGVGERGEDLGMLKAHGLPKLIATEGKRFPFVTAAPQCPPDGWWSTDREAESLGELLDAIVSSHRIDEDRIYVTGLSMGGFGTWRLACDAPGRFAAIAPICGGGDPRKAGLIRHLPVWAFHGAKDSIVPIGESQAMVDALRACGGNVRFTIYPEAEHDCWTETYDNPELYDWLLKHRRAPEPWR